MKCEILAIGTELLMGQIANTNAQYISARLPEAGLGVYYHSVIGDNPERIREGLAIAVNRADIIIMTGGLGPTKDDLTKETVGAFFNRPMVLHEEILKKIEDYFSQIGREMVESNKRQAYFPKDAVILQNPNGTAPGCIVEADGKSVILLPGPPSEMKPMFDLHVMPYIAAKNDKKIYSKFVRLFGVGESSMETNILDLIENQTNPTIAPYVKDAQITLRVTAMADTYEQACACMQPLIDTLYQRLGQYIFHIGDEDLIPFTIRRLIERNMKIAVAESCTGGMIASKIVDLAGASSVFELGVTAYGNEAKAALLNVQEQTLSQFGAVSEQTAREMAIGALQRSGADVAVATTGIAGPDGGTPDKPVGLVYIAVALKADSQGEMLVRCKPFQFSGERQKIRTFATMHAFHMVLKQI